MSCFVYMDANELKFRKLLGARIQELRQARNLTQPQLAAAIGFKDYQSIGRIENGRVTASVYTIYQILKALEVNPNELLDF